VAVGAISAIALVVLLPLAPAFPAGLFSHYSCQNTTRLESEVLWTPNLFVNAPWNGWVNGTAIILQTASASVSVSINASFGVVSGDFQLENWTLYRTSQALVAGPGTNVACDAPFSATAVSSGSLVSTSIESPGSANQTDLPTQISDEGFASVLFNVSFSLEKPHETWYTCPPGGGGGLSGVAPATNFTVPFTYDGSSVDLSESNGAPANWTYSIPVGGVYEYTPSWSGGLAFNYSPCP
jgi:hypothetical protein